MDIVLGVSMEPSAVRLVLIEGANADGATVEEESIDVAAQGGADSDDAATDRVIAALVGTREGAIEGGYELSSTGVTWTDPAEVAALRLELAARDVGGVMLVSPLLAAAALAQNVGAALDYEHIAMLFVEDGSATLAVVEIADGSIVDLHRQSVRDQSLAAGLVTMVVGLDAPGSRADGVFLVGCGVDIVDVKPALEAATSLVVSCPEEPEMALARGAALASANAPLFASSTSALAYALDPGTGEVNPRALTPSYLDVCAMAGVSEGALAYSAIAEETDPELEAETRRRPLALVSAAIVGVAAVAAGLIIVSLGSHVRTTAAQQSGPRDGAATPAIQAPATELPAQVLLPAPSAAPPPTAAPAPSAAPPPVAVAAPPPVVQQPPPQTVTRPAQAPAYLAPAPRRQPTRQAAPPVQTPVQQAPEPSAPPPAAPAPAAPAPAAPTPIMTMYLHLPFVSIPIPINPPPPPPPPAEPGP
ncbi:DUF7159 family protein [Mycobacterium camsae]|uniref:DUF7159 family protein n=1 Tax=Mycobacterium gordonae TaxID=1778 RepID=UPI00197F3AA4|nr:hypothetical protein [Mycobacterium gordonae]